MQPYDGLRIYYDRYKARSSDVGLVEQASTVKTINGTEDDVWRNGEQRNLTYCVSNGFNASKGAVINDMALATQAWEAVRM